MVLSKWIPICDAISEFFESRLEEDVFLSHGYVYKQAVRAMIDLTLPAKPAHKDDYILEFRSDSETKKFPLNPDGTIPGLFWIFFEEAFSNWQSQTNGTTDYADLGSDTHFQRGGLKDNGVMIGEAGLVLIERAKFPGLPRRRGERGPSKASEHNLSIAREAVCLIAAGETQRAAVAKLFMQVKANSEPAQKAELRRLIKVASKNAD